MGRICQVVSDNDWRCAGDCDKSSILLLDDATASVDPETEYEIREAIVAAMHDRTTIVVSNRLSTLSQTDRIVVLQDGTISVGTHEELLEACDWYRELAELQGLSARRVSRAVVNFGKHETMKKH